VMATCNQRSPCSQPVVANTPRLSSSRWRWYMARKRSEYSAAERIGALRQAHAGRRYKPIVTTCWQGEIVVTPDTSATAATCAVGVASLQLVGRRRLAAGNLWTGTDAFDRRRPWNAPQIERHDVGGDETSRPQRSTGLDAGHSRPISARSWSSSTDHVPP